MNTPIEILLAVARVGGRLGIRGDKLRMLLPGDCPLQLKDRIRQHKAALLDLLGLNFLVVHSDTLKATLFWTPDDTTKESLVAAGADPGSIYTRAELDVMVHRSLNVGELPPIHAAKQRFSGKLRQP